MGFSYSGRLQESHFLKEEDLLNMSWWQVFHSFKRIFLKYWWHWLECAALCPVSSPWLTARLNRLTQPSKNSPPPPRVQLWSRKIGMQPLCALQFLRVLEHFRNRLNWNARQKEKNRCLVKTIWRCHYLGRFKVVGDFPKVPELLADFTQPWLGER